MEVRAECCAAGVQPQGRILSLGWLLAGALTGEGQPSGRGELWPVPQQRAVSKFQCCEGSLDLRKRAVVAEEAREGRRVPTGPGSPQGTQTPGQPSVLGGSLFKPLSKEPVILTTGSTL